MVLQRYWLGTHAIFEAPKSPIRSASLRFGGGLGGKIKARVRPIKADMVNVD